MNGKEVIEKRIKENLELGNSLESIKKHLVKIYPEELVNEVINKFNRKDRAKENLIKIVKSSFIQKASLIIFGIFLALIILESGLRITGFVATFEQDYENSPIEFVNLENEDAVRILALGESTTAGGGDSWPSQLERLLNERSSKIKFKVYNEGTGGTTTAFILSRLKRDLEIYNPDIVITMMGINDRTVDTGRLVYRENETLKTKFIFFLKSFRLYRLYKWLLFSWENKINFEDNQLVNEIMNKYHEENGTLRQQGKLREAINTLNEIIQVKDDYRAYAELGFVYYDLKEFDKAEEMFKKSIEISPRKSRPAYYGLEQIYRLRKIDDKGIKEFYNEHGYSFDINDDPDFEVTKYHYRLMYKILNENGIKLIVMQYPTLDILELKKIFTKNESIIFISNEENFMEALENGKYEDYFIDHIRDSFGHATPTGNKLIAENVANTLEE